MKGFLDLAKGSFPDRIAVDGALDPEEVLRLYEHHGEAMLPRLRGPFALALWDGRALLLARDAFGARPLLYCTQGRALWFASRATGLKGAPRGQIDRGALSDYLELLYVPSPATIWSNVRKLPAGHLLHASEAGVEVRRWYDPPVPGASEKRPSRIAVRARLEESVRAALKGTEPPGALLSGGLDSSALVALMTRQMGRVRTFTAAYAAEDLEAAHRIAERFRSDHGELLLAEPGADEVSQAIEACGEPFGDATIVPQVALMRPLPCKAVLTGDGADELFAGGARYLRAARLPRSRRVARAAELLKRLAPRKHRGRLQRAALALGSKGAGRARALVDLFSADERRALLGFEARTARSPDGADLQGADAVQAFDLEVALPDQVLFRLDAAGELCGIDARAAFADPALARAVVPPAARHKLRRGVGKRLLREAVADLLPRDVLFSEPRGMEPPVGAWLRGPLRTLLHDLVRAPSARIRALLDPRAVDEVLSHSLAARGNPRQAWALLALEIWARSQRG